jgi:hypothetical protein
VAPILSENSTLALLLGASEYPDADDLSNPAFERSARAFRSYLLNSLKLNERNIFYHFNEDDWPGALEDKVSKWIKTRKSETNAENIFLYYVGHGIAKDRTFYMTIRKSCKGKEDSHCLSAKVLRKALYESGPGSCFWVILDCCYSASAFADFQDDGPRGGGGALCVGKQ